MTSMPTHLFSGRIAGYVIAVFLAAMCGLGLSDLGQAAESQSATAEQELDDGGRASSDTPAPSVHVARQPLLDLSFLGRWTGQRMIGDIEIGQIIGAFLFILVGLVAKKVSDFVLENKLIPLLKKTAIEFDHLVTIAASKPTGYLLMIGGLAGACRALPFPPHIDDLVFGTLKVLVAADVVWFLFRIVDVIVEYLTRLTDRTESQLDDQLVPLLRKALKITIVLVGTVTTLQILGINVTGLVAGLGIGGLAVALGLQDTLANFFGSVFIFIDRPFAVGDWIKLGDVEGTVTAVGFRSTRVRTFPATIVTIPNKTVADATIDNRSKMPKRRVYQTIGLTYETTADQMQQAVKAIREIIENDDGVDQEYIVVRFSDFADSSLNITVYYFTKPTAFADHMMVKERINLAIMRAIDDLGLSIAFPTQTVYFEGQIARDIAQQNVS